MENKTVSGLGTVFSWSGGIPPGCGADPAQVCAIVGIPDHGSRMTCASQMWWQEAAQADVLY
ncbi:MAG: hypothetical protein SOR41_04235 [Eubacteriales bacterium]|nr:hypothetical protein [Eubacteriaceae bacterium]MDD6477740.1 hypothetical protein [Eubacteriales bacterium]MDY3037519.1 hypothetical protein [Eubacteriales bacterium]